ALANRIFVKEKACHRRGRVCSPEKETARDFCLRALRLLTSAATKQESAMRLLCVPLNSRSRFKQIVFRPFAHRIGRAMERAIDCAVRQLGIAGSLVE